MKKNLTILTLIFTLATTAPFLAIAEQPKAQTPGQPISSSQEKDHNTTNTPDTTKESQPTTSLSWSDRIKATYAQACAAVKSGLYRVGQIAENVGDYFCERTYFGSFAFLKDFAAAYATHMGSVLIHELGHALTAKLLCNCPINIHIGNDTDSPLITVPGLTIRSFYPYEGGYACQRFTQEPHPLAFAAICLAGPLAGIITSTWLCKKLAQKNTQQAKNSGVAHYKVALTVSVLEIFIELLQLLPSLNRTNPNKPQPNDGQWVVECLRKYRNSAYEPDWAIEKTAS